VSGLWGADCARGGLEVCAEAKRLNSMRLRPAHKHAVR